MAGRKVLDEREALELMAEAQRRGVKPSEIAVERGIDGRSMNAWRMTFQRSGRLPEPAFVELVAAGTTTQPSVYRVLVEDMAVEVSDDFDERTLRRLVGVLRAC